MKTPAAEWVGEPITSYKAFLPSSAFSYTPTPADHLRTNRMNRARQTFLYPVCDCAGTNRQMFIKLIKEMFTEVVIPNGL